MPALSVCFTVAEWKEFDHIEENPFVPVMVLTLSMLSNTLPALLGGSPVRPGGPPVWPRRLLETDAVLDSMKATGDWGRYHGPHSDRLCEILSGSLQAQAALLCSSGTAAIELALRGCQVGPGDEVILSAYDFKANFTNVALLGAMPVLVDCQEEDAQLQVSAVEAACTDRTKAVIASHLQGGIVDMVSLREIASRRGISVIEDACQSPGAIVQGRPAGAWGDVATLSFGGSKLVSAGRGGAVITSRPEIAQRIRLYQQRGNEAYPLSEMQAALLLPQWQRLESDNTLRGLVASALDDIPGLISFRAPSRMKSCTTTNEAALEESFTSHSTPHGDRSTPVYYKLGYWYDSKVFGGLTRERFCRSMRAEGIALDPGFSGLHQIHARRRFRASGELMHASRACSSVVMLHHPLLLEGMTAARDFRRAVDKIASHAKLLREIVLPPDSSETFQS